MATTAHHSIVVAPARKYKIKFNWKTLGGLIIIRDFYFKTIILKGTGTSMFTREYTMKDLNGRSVLKVKQAKHGNSGMEVYRSGTLVACMTRDENYDIQIMTTDPESNTTNTRRLEFGRTENTEEVELRLEDIDKNLILGYIKREKPCHFLVEVTGTEEDQELFLTLMTAPYMAQTFI
eukprot:TRINITY_DN8831_c0_g1_i1.p1 TRINITY_DN8831_c0_g1~~TRINITY_DN8831_c0_g1_i1.p1  ORF type:complete len:178 (+),score=20.96 TRINITY_DN8831_c0_g1_i1:36-569(+)